MSVKPIEITAYQLAERFVGLSEVSGPVSDPTILAMLRLDQAWPEGDETPWCSAFVNYIAWMLRLPRSKRLNARSWLGIGVPVMLGDAEAGFDVAIFSRGSNAPGPEVLDAPGHVAFLGSVDGPSLLVLGGNQGDRVSLARYPISRLLGIRRLR